MTLTNRTYNATVYLTFRKDCFSEGNSTAMYRFITQTHYSMTFKYPASEQTRFSLALPSTCDGRLNLARSNVYICRTIYYRDINHFRPLPIQSVSGGICHNSGHCFSGKSTRAVHKETELFIFNLLLYLQLNQTCILQSTPLHSWYTAPNFFPVMKRVLERVLRTAAKVPYRIFFYLFYRTYIDITKHHCIRSWKVMDTISEEL